MAKSPRIPINLLDTPENKENKEEIFVPYQNMEIYEEKNNEYDDYGLSVEKKRYILIAVAVIFIIIFIKWL